MNLNLFDNKNLNNDFADNFINELKNALEDFLGNNNQNNELDEYNLYEKKKVFLDNFSRKGNDLAWIMDSNSVCISEDGDGGPVSINEVDLPDNKKVGEVYEKIDGKFVLNLNLTAQLSDFGS